MQRPFSFDRESVVWGYGSPLNPSHYRGGGFVRRTPSSEAPPAAVLVESSTHGHPQIV